MKGGTRGPAKLLSQQASVIQKELSLRHRAALAFNGSLAGNGL